MEQHSRDTSFVQTDNDNNDDMQPDGYLYGDLELKIICISLMENDPTCTPNWPNNPEVDIAICLYKKKDACSKISRDYDDSTKQHTFQVSIAHCLNSNLEVRFKLEKNEGKAIVPCTSIDGKNNLEGWFPVSGKPLLARVMDPLTRNYPIKLFVQLQVTFTPCNKNSLYKGGIGEKYELKESYFPLRTGGKVTLYQDAHCDSNQSSSIKLKNNSLFKRGTCWEDIYNAIRNADKLVCIVGWDIFQKVRLVREQEGSSETLGELLKQKSRDGVKVHVLAWNEFVDMGKLSVGGFMKTKTKETTLYFENKEGEHAHDVKCVLAHRNDINKSKYVTKKFKNLVLTHHQKCVIVDHNNEITAFIGGLDLCSGRYDTPNHQLYSDHNTVFRDDFVNATFQSKNTNYPREPWHDLHCKIEGEAAIDVLTNFKQRWQEATNEEIKDDYKDDYPCADHETWNVQIFRSIDSGSVTEFPSKTFNNHSKSLTTEKPIEKGALIWQNDMVIDRSIQMAYIQAIRSAQHFIYIENQFFHGSLPNQNIGGENLIPMELALKIASKIKENKPFRVYVIIPMWPEGDPTSNIKQYMLHWQGQTMEMMYKIIAQEIKSTKLNNAHPTDYLNFYCLGKREIPPQDTPNEGSLPSHKYRRFMIYVHSKGMIADDAYVILGSANINHRSMDGSRDTEIAMGAYQPHYIWTKENQHPRGQVYGYRMSLWQEHFKKIDTIFDKPETLDCVNYVNDVAENNWKKFTDNEFTSLQGHILKYPVEVDGDGNVKPKLGHENFPDVDGKVLGTKPPRPLMSVGLIKEVIGMVLT